METILLTGGTGFVGRELVGRLRLRFPDAAIVVAAPAPVDGLAADFVAFDLLDPDSIRNVVAAVRPSVLVHLAGLTHVQEAQNSGEIVWRANALGAVHLAEAVLAHAPDCRLLFVSSGEVYGVSGNDIPQLAEDAPLGPANAYAVTKCAAELTFQEAALRGLRVVRARPFNHTGPTQEPRFVVPRIVAQVAKIAKGEQDPILRLGALDRSRDFLHVHDVCDAYCAMIDTFDDLGAASVFNIASGQARTIQSIVADIVELAGIECEVVSEPSALRPYDVQRLCGDAGKLRKTLGWAPKIAWRELLQEMLAYHLR